MANESGCLPHRVDTLNWHQIFLANAMSAETIADFSEALDGYLSESDRAALVSALERFQPRFRKVWRDLDHVRSFERRFHRFLANGELLAYLESVASFFGVDSSTGPPMRISFVGLPAAGGTHAEADGEHLLIEIRPRDTPRDQIQVIAHEATHFLMRQLDHERVDRLARQAYNEGPAGPLIWRYMWEGIPTALGQGLSAARLAPRRFSMEHSWYHIPVIDRFAKLIYPSIAVGMKRSERLDQGMMTRLTRVLRGSSLYREAHAAGFLTHAFYASGDGLSDELRQLRRRVGLGHHADAMAFDLNDPQGKELLRRYDCVGGMAMVSPTELKEAVSLDGTALLSAEDLDDALSRARAGHEVIAAGHRPGGGVIYYLIIPSGGSAERLIEAFARLRGVPEAPLAVAPR